MTRPNDVSTTSAPSSCASSRHGERDRRVVEHAGDEDALARRAASARLGPSGPTSGVFAWRRGGRCSRFVREASERRSQHATRVGRRDHVVDVAALGRDVRVGEAVLVLVLERGLLAAARSSSSSMRAQPCGRAGSAPRPARPSPRSRRSATRRTSRCRAPSSPSRCTRRRTPCAARRTAAARWPPRTRARARRRGGSSRATRGPCPARSRACRRT